MNKKGQKVSINFSSKQLNSTHRAIFNALKFYSYATIDGSFHHFPKEGRNFMDRHLSIVTHLDIQEKRILPRYPLCYLIFKAQGQDHSYEVKNISMTGMQLELREETNPHCVGDELIGQLSWQGRRCSMRAEVKWVKSAKVGVQFNFPNEQARRDFQIFIDLKQIVASLKPLHELEVSEKPSNLSCWLRADGPVELFIWRDLSGQFISQFQIIIFDQFIEWDHNSGLITGKVLSKRDLETPLFSEDEFIFSVDPVFNEKRRSVAQGFIQDILKTRHHNEEIEFVDLKLR